MGLKVGEINQGEKHFVEPKILILLQNIMDPSESKNGAKSDMFRKDRSQDPIHCDEGPGVVAYLLTLGSFLLVAASLPFSLFFVVKVVQVDKTQSI